MARNLTGLNAVIVLTAPDVFASGVQLQGFAADNVFESDPISSVEILMGVDYNLSAGFVAAPVPQAFELQADSLSIDFIEAIQLWQMQNLMAEQISGTTTLLATGKSYSMPKGFMTIYGALPGVKKLIQPRRFSCMWERVIPSVIA
jgi:hypothetical protein